jgi:23S rRNA U2552 (ribose-2'-O)-methylase RlmE/FtsJ
MKHFLMVDGVIAAQTPRIEPAFRSVLNQFSTIIEIGFDRGALSLWLYRNKHENTKLVSYDISFGGKIINDIRIDFRLGNCFSQEVINEIKDLIQLPGKTLVLCDGGNKEKEFELYSTFLKPGDVIMLHDYAHSAEDYDIVVSETGWRTVAESKFENIQGTIENCNLKPYHYDVFKNALWGSFFKQ